jgi:branched-chain amino acid transport system substrate-binding protein
METPPCLSRRPRIAPRPQLSGAARPLRRCLGAACLLLAALCAVLMPDSAPAGAKTPLHIGFVIGLTGPGAPEESDIWNGALLAVEEINASDAESVRISMTAHDTRNQPIAAKAAAKEAIAAGATLLLAPSYSSQALEAARTAQESGIPIISVIATHPDIVAVGDNVFRVCFDDHDQARTMAAFARKVLGAATATILTDLTSAYSLAMTAAFRERFTSLGGRVAAEIDYKMRQRGFDAEVRQAVRAGADVLFMPGYWLDGSAMVKGMHEAGLTSIPLAGDGWGSSRFEELRGNLPAHGYYTDHWAAFMADEGSRRFVQAFVQRFGRPPVAGAALAYDAVRVAARAASLAGSNRPERLRHSLGNIRDFPGVTGSMSFSARGETRKSVHIMEITNGKAGLLRTVNPDETF